MGNPSRVLHVFDIKNFENNSSDTTLDFASNNLSQSPHRSEYSSSLSDSKMTSYENNEKSTYYLKLSGDSRTRYDQKILGCDGIDPYAIKPKDLSTNSKDFPDITMYDIGDYMIHSVSPFTKRFLDNFKGTEAYKYFESGFVLNIGSKNTTESVIVLGKVQHSQRMNDTPLQTWILAKKDGKILCAHCTCIAGLSESCSHVGAICFAINKISEARETKSVTDILCKWNVPSFKQASVSAAKDITWKFPSHERTTLESSFLEHCDSFTNLSDETIDQFILKCQSVGDDPALSTLYSSEKKRNTKIRDELFLANLYNEIHKNKPLRELVEIGKMISLDLTNDEVNEIFNLTLPRLKSKCSVGLRRGRITGSNFKNCCTANIEDPSITTIRRVIHPVQNLDHVPSIKYQIRNRKKAIQHYNRLADSKHEDFLYIECGLVINSNLPNFVGSSDGHVSCFCHGRGCVEVKCLNIEEPEALDEFLTRQPKNILNKFNDQYSLERSHEFYYQVQLNINLRDSNYCDCVIWSPRQVIVMKVYADIDFWKVALEKALIFHEQAVMPELLGKYYTDKTGVATSSEESENYEDDFELIGLEIEHLDSFGYN